jgi:HSP20 family molecular chaperone IbpA
MVHGDQSDDEDRIYLHRSIAARQFQRGFVIADGISVIDAELNNGLLYIDLNRPPPDSDIKLSKLNLTMEPKRTQRAGQFQRCPKMNFLRGNV